MPTVKSKIISQYQQRQIKPNRTLSIKDFYQKRNQVLVFRGLGGLGDILMHRMLFEDMKRIMPDVEIHFACPTYYHDAVRDHPLIDKLLDSGEVNRNDYIVCYNTTTSCGRTEMKLAPFAGPHRSDIWAATCGFLLTKHDMHIRMTEEEQAEGKRLIEKHRDRNGPCVVLCPNSAMIQKNLTEDQLKGLCDGLRDRGLFVLGLHHEPLWSFIKRDIPCHSDRKIRNWMAVINQADYVISVDSAAFHAASGMNKPLMGVFAFTDGKVYGKYADFVLVQKHRDDNPEWTCGPCYNYTSCPKTREMLKPCLTEITKEMLLNKVDTMLAKWPKEKDAATNYTQN